MRRRAKLRKQNNIRKGQNPSPNGWR